MNPIESVFGGVKHYLEANGILFDTSLSPSLILLMAFNSITVSNCKVKPTKKVKRYLII